MPVTLITGPHQSGKSRRLWERLRAAPLGSAVLVRPSSERSHDLIRQVHAWSGPGLLPPVWSFADLVERCAATVEAAPRALSTGLLTHALRTWAAKHLHGPWLVLAGFRATGRELAELVRRLDDHGVTDADIALAQRMLHERGENVLVSCLNDVVTARAQTVAIARAQGAALAGARLRLLADSGAAPSIATIAFDDFQTFTPAELAFIRSLGDRRQLIITAVDDGRLGRDASLADRLRAGLPGATEERLSAIAEASPHAPGVRAVLGAALEEGRPIAPDGVACYRYRDPLHAGRAVAAWLRRAGVAPAQALLVVRVADAEALALADALAAAGIPVNGRFQVPFLGTTAGGALAALATFCREQTWGSFLAVAERLAVEAPPVRLTDLAGPWSRLGVDEGLAKIDTLAQDPRDSCDGWGWNEPGAGRPWLVAAVTWLTEQRERLRAEGTWWQRLVVLTTRLDLSDGGSGVLRTLADMAALHPLSPEDLDELLGAARITVERDAGAPALEITDAVRGRTWPRPVVFIHDLEHGRWSSLPATGALMPGDERRHLAAVLGRDIYDEAGRAAGEIGSFLAVIGRATQRVVFGIPCGEREPCAWLGTLCDQVGWDLEKLREDAGGEAVPGAPLGTHDAQGAHEHALWSVVPGNPSFSFRVPPVTDLKRLELKVSGLGTVFRDAFAVVCDRLCLGEPLVDQEVMDEGSELHDLLAGLVEVPPVAWPQELARRLPSWIAAAPDALKRIERARRARRVVEVITAEAIPAADADRREAEVRRVVPITVPGHEPLMLTGYIDRVDHLGDGRVRLIDYKRGALSSQTQALKDGNDGQLLGYLLAARAAGWQAEGAYYLSLRDGARAGWGVIPTPGGRQASKAGTPLTELDRLATELGQAIAALAAGSAAADPEGRSATDYAAIARADERRLDVGGES
jgi:RecB family exonuclease